MASSGIGRENRPALGNITNSTRHPRSGVFSSAKFRVMCTGRCTVVLPGRGKFICSCTKGHFSIPTVSSSEEEAACIECTQPLSQHSDYPAEDVPLSSLPHNHQPFFLAWFRKGKKRKSLRIYIYILLYLVSKKRPSHQCKNIYCRQRLKTP